MEPISPFSVDVEVYENWLDREEGASPSPSPFPVGSLGMVFFFLSLSFFFSIRIFSFFFFSFLVAKTDISFIFKSQRKRM